MIDSNIDPSIDFTNNFSQELQLQVNTGFVSILKLFYFIFEYCVEFSV